MLRDVDDAALTALLSDARRIAVVGASNKPHRASHGVMQYLLAHGYDVIPVNPLLAGQHILGQRVVGTLAEIDGQIDIVDIFRASDVAGIAVDEAIAAGARAVWLQLGVIDEPAAERARAAGLTAVMDRCIKIEIARLGVAARG